MQGLKYLGDLLNLKQVGAFLLEDLTVSWKFILFALGLAAIASVKKQIFDLKKITKMK